MKECADQILLLSLPVSGVDPCSFLCVVVYKVKLVVVISAEVPAGWQRYLRLLAARFWHSSAIQQQHSLLQSALLTQRPHSQLNTSVRRPPWVWRPRPPARDGSLTSCRNENLAALCTHCGSTLLLTNHRTNTLGPLTQADIHFSPIFHISEITGQLLEPEGSLDRTIQTSPERWNKEIRVFMWRIQFFLSIRIQCPSSHSEFVYFRGLN